MTTEIAIMNKSAVALAADSAVTINVAGPQRRLDKVLNSANKLFALSKHVPVGLMVYGNANMLGIPWETIVKMYRDNLGAREFETLSDYSADFFSFLDRFDLPAGSQEDYVVQGAVVLFDDLRETLDKWVEERLAAKREVDTSEVEHRLKSLIKARFDEFEIRARESVFSKARRTRLRTKYRPLVKDIARNIFESLPLSAPMISWLTAIALDAASVGPSNQSGIVIAGFGAKDLYPSCASYDVAAVFEGKTIKRDRNVHAISHDIGAAIVPFAQSADVETFMEGIAPGLMMFLNRTFYGIMANNLPDRLRDEAGDKLCLTDQQRSEVRKIAGDMCKGACDYAFGKLKEKQQKDYWEPVVSATEFLNKAELAAMAETLVNLVSFRKQVTMDIETVGGPIDVAIITKGDGLVWIKRKNYFPAELNHHFFSNYYGRSAIHERNKGKESNL